MPVATGGYAINIILLSGGCDKRLRPLSVDGIAQTLHPGDMISIAAGCKHTLSAITNMRIIEVQVGTEISANDKLVYPTEP